MEASAIVRNREMSSHATARTNQGGGSLGTRGACSSHSRGSAAAEAGVRIVSDVQLLARQIKVQTARGHQLVMRPGLHDGALFQHHDLMSIPDGAETVGDDDRAAPTHHSREILLNGPLRFGIQSTGGLVKN